MVLSEELDGAGVTRIFLTKKQKAEIWDKWQRGESMSSIGRVFDRGSSSISPFLSALVVSARRANKIPVGADTC